MEWILALWYGASEGAVVAKWQGGRVELQVYAEAAGTRDALLDEFQVVAPDASWGDATAREPRRASYYWVFAINQTVDEPWILHADADLFDASRVPSHESEGRHIGWCGWALTVDHTIRSPPGETPNIEVHVRADDSVTVCVSDHASEQQLRRALDDFFGSVGRCPAWRLALQLGALGPASARNIEGPRTRSAPRASCGGTDGEVGYCFRNRFSALPAQNHLI
jgi:hypothetical protein